MAEHTKNLNIQDLGRFLRHRRTAKSIGLRGAAVEAGVSFNTLARVERGHVPDLETFARLARWLGRSPADFLGGEAVTADSTPDVIETHLRDDPALSPEAAGRIAGIVREFYGEFAKPSEVIACHLRAASTFTPEASVLFAELLREMYDVLLTED